MMLAAARMHRKGATRSPAGSPASHEYRNSSQLRRLTLPQRDAPDLVIQGSARRCTERGFSISPAFSRRAISPTALCTRSCAHASGRCSVAHVASFTWLVAKNRYYPSDGPLQSVPCFASPTREPHLRQAKEPRRMLLVRDASSWTSPRVRASAWCLIHAL